jgi:hypothetical protein
MKTFKLSVILTMLTIALFSCKKPQDELLTDKIIGENLMRPTINAKIVIDTVLITKQSPSEDGYKIFFDKDGQVTQLGCKFPQPGNYRVSFWDFDNQEMIGSATISITEVGNFKYINIAPINVVANKRYMLSINNSQNGVSVANYMARKIDHAVFFPFTTGSVTFEQPFFKFSSSTVFPNVPAAKNMLNDLPDLTFVPGN